MKNILAAFLVIASVLSASSQDKNKVVYAEVYKAKHISFNSFNNPDPKRIEGTAFILYVEHENSDVDIEILFFNEANKKESWSKKLDIIRPLFLYMPMGEGISKHSFLYTDDYSDYEEETMSWIFDSKTEQVIAIGVSGVGGDYIADFNEIEFMYSTEDEQKLDDTLLGLKRELKAYKHFN